MDELIGKKLEGRYLLESLVGVGGMANVYKGRDLKTDAVVAVKILREEFSQNTELVRRFKNESKAISILDHPNIVKVFDVSVTDRLQFIVMEYIDGITLKEYMNRRGGPLTWKEVVHFCQQVLDALDHAHQKGVVHRDIKPQNIMLLADGRVKIMDFGIARFSRAEYQDTSEKAIGSVHYISPEQAKGDVTDAKADIYSMGVMMYEMLSGKLPFESDSAVSVAIKQIADTAAPLSEVAPDVPKALQDITARAMAKDPARRYPSARAMLNDLEEFKKNPSIRFEYEYMTEDSPARYIDKVVKQSSNGPSGRRTPSSQGPRKAQAPSSGSKSGGPRKSRRKVGVLPILAGMAAAFALGSAILCYLIFANSTNPLFSNKKDVELPDFTGMQWETVKDQYSGQLTLVAEQEYNAQYEEGVIYYQSPRGPRTVKEGQKVTVKVSLGTLYVNVPDVTQWKIADAAAHDRGGRHPCRGHRHPHRAGGRRKYCQRRDHLGLCEPEEDRDRDHRASGEGHFPGGRPEGADQQQPGHRRCYRGLQQRVRGGHCHRLHPCGGLHRQNLLSGRSGGLQGTRAHAGTHPGAHARAHPGAHAQPGAFSGAHAEH